MIPVAVYIDMADTPGSKTACNLPHLTGHRRRCKLLHDWKLFINKKRRWVVSHWGYLRAISQHSLVSTVEAPVP